RRCRRGCAGAGRARSGAERSRRPLRDADRPDHAVAQLELDSRQWALRWAGERPAGREVEVALVAGAVEAAAVDLGQHRAGEVGAALVEGDHFARAEPDQQLRLSRSRILELPEAADRQLV